MNQANYPNTVVAAVALITSFGANSGRNGGGGGGQNTEEPEAVAAIHLAVDSDNDSYNDDKSVKSFGLDGPNERGTNDDSIFIADAPNTVCEMGNDNINNNIVTGDDDNNNYDNNSADNTPSDKTNEGSTKDDSVSKDRITSFATTQGC